MGTWGTGPFDSDMAEDFVDRLEDLSPEQRAGRLRARLEKAVADGDDKLPGEVLAAAAVVAAGLPAGRDLSWNEDYEGIESWLSPDQAGDLAGLADRALEVTFAPDGWYWASWTDEEESDEARAVQGRLRQVLRS
jgi:hypothetical protein